MGHNDPLLQILILLTASVCVVAGVRKLALPAILGYLAVGMLLGPHALSLAADNETTQLLADFGVVFLVFTLGLEFSLPRLVAMRWEVLGVGGAQVLVTTGVVAAGAILAFDVAPAVAVVIGGAVAMSSTAIIIAQLTEQSENNRTHGRLAVAICLFQDLSFPLFLALVSSLSGGQSAGAVKVASAIGIAVLALLLVLAAGRWLLRPLFLVIASVRSAELFSLAVLLAVLASAWATHAVGLSLALGAFLAGMMLAETEFRHQIEATIRSYPAIPLGLFFITVGMLLDVRLLLLHLPLVTVILAAMLLLKAAVVTVVAKPATKSWFKSLRTGVVVGQGGEFGFALLILLLRRELLEPALVQPLLAATVLSMVLSPILIRQNRPITRALLGESGPPISAAAVRETQATLAVAGREHVIICGFGRVGQNIARVLEQTGFEFIALELDAYRIRAGRQAGDPVIYGDAGEGKVLENVGIARASCVVITFTNPEVALRILRSVRELREDVPILVRTQDDTKLEQLQSAGATEVVPETFEASLMLLSHLLLLLKLPVPRVIRTVNEIRTRRYSRRRQYCRAADAGPLDDSHAFREELHSVVLPPHAWAVGRSIEELAARGSRAVVSAVRRDGIVGREPSPDTRFKEGDVVVICGTPEGVEHAETLLLMG